MSIYIAIPSMYDRQLPYTVKEAIKNAENPDDLSIGVVFMDIVDNSFDQDKFYKEEVEPLSEYKQVSLKRFLHGEYEPSIGFGRHAAMSFYNDQDYVLQIDSHTKFDKGWDTNLIELYKGALKETNNDKTVLTAYLPPYMHDDAGVRGHFGHVKHAKYPMFIYEFRFDGNLPSWRDFTLMEGPNAKEELYLPCVKFNAQFAFSNKRFLEVDSLPKDIIFWEEELIQTMNLLDAGYSLVFPNQALPLSHLYFQDVNQDVRSTSFRCSGANPKKLDIKDFVAVVRESYFSFIKDPANKDKVDRFYKYSRVHPKFGPYQDYYIPPEYNR